RTAESSTMRAGSAMVSPQARLAAAVLSQLLEPPIVALPHPEGPFRVATTLSKMKGGFCVSTVSIVSGRVPGSTGVVAGCIYYLGRRLAQPKIVIVGADDADGADGIFGPRMDPDHPGSGSTFTTEGDVDAQHPQDCLCTMQVARQRSCA